MRVLNLLAEVFAILAGLLLTTITLMTCVSLIGRNFFETTLAGDFELTGVAAGAAIALFMPYCQATRANIIVDFFTATLKAPQQARLNRLGALMVALMFALLTWRTVLGGLNSYNTHSETQILGFPEWTVYATMVPAFVLTSLIGLAQSLWAVSSPEQGAAT